MGPSARTYFERHGLSPESFCLMLTASGGPRWLGICGIDRALAKFLSARSQSKLALLGASSGAWRIAALASDSSGDAYSELEEAYINQRYYDRPSPDEVSSTCQSYLAKIFSPQRISYALNRSNFQLNITTAILKPSQSWLMGALIAMAALNAIDRRLIGRVVERGLFAGGKQPLHSPIKDSVGWDQIPTRCLKLTESNFVLALLASGSIPTVLRGVDDLPEAGPGRHYDGGLIDYHFEVENALAPVLYPHFSSSLVPGWLDRFLPQRRLTAKASSWLCLIIPSVHQLSRYPGGRLPDRHDFTRSTNEERIERWQTIVKENKALEQELTSCLEAGELLKVSQRLS